MSYVTKDEGADTTKLPSNHKLPAWTDGIAIIGMSARFPQSQNVEEFWRHLLNGELLIREWSEEELRQVGVDELTLSNPDYVRKGSVIDGADLLDAEFFGFSRRDAEIIDPQQRVLLECASDAMENAGYTGEQERVGIFAGIGISAYLLQLLGNPAIVASAGFYQLMLANDKDYVATRIAYKLDFRGPAMTVQTACSTSLAAVHLACQSILAGECDIALAGGVSIAIPQGTGYPYMPGMILSPDGYCRPFDAEANGTVPGRGAGLVVLKSLSQALADGDMIRAVIRGSAWNNDGSGKVGYTVPSVDGQAAVIRQALSAAGVTADRIGYVEAHGTATELGDPIEVTALTTVFTEDKAKAGACVLGSLKSNMGHADTAAGVAGLIKATLAVESGIIPPTLNYRHPNPYAGLEGSPFTVSASTEKWQSENERWSGVSSYGIGGTNVHVILSNAPERPTLPNDVKPRIYPVSARTPTALVSSCSRLATHLESHDALLPEDIASTLQVGRRKFVHRRAVVATDLVDLTTQLRNVQTTQGGVQEFNHDVVFLFPGQGQQFTGMAATLYSTDPVFRKMIDEGAMILREMLSLNVIDYITRPQSHSLWSERLTETEIAQPVLFLTEYALAKRWISLGVEPAALLGHSLGELTAATVAGVFSFSDGLRLAVQRGRLMANTTLGMMLAVVLPAEKLSSYLGQDVWLAAENGPRMSVVSGTVDAIEKLELRFAADRVSTVRLASRNAFHTPLMAEAATAFRLVVESTVRHAPRIPWLSNVTGTWIRPEEAQSPQYWGNQILARVRFTQNLVALAERPRFLLEVGPGEALIGIARRQMQRSIFAASLGSESRRRTDQEIFLETVARAWEYGIPISWQSLQPDSKLRRVPLPTYPFERQRYWVDAVTPPKPPAAETIPQCGATSARAGEVTGKKRADIASWFYAPSWQSTPPASVLLQHVSGPAGCWIILSDCSSLSEALIHGLQQTGAQVIAVSIGDKFALSGNGAFTINPSDAGDYKLLWQEISNSGLHPTKLLNLWTLRGTSAPAYDSLVHLLQAARPHRQRFDQIEIVTDQLQSVAGEGIEDVDRAVILGLIRVIPVEYNDVQCRCIDVRLQEEEITAVTKQLLDEVQTQAPGSTIAYRGRTRWQKIWTSAPLREASKSPFRERGVYLITGGMGGIGYIFARYLLQNHQARVVLTGRTAMPSRADWPTWLLAHPFNDPVSRRILRMQEMESAGGEVLFLAVDVSSKSAMAGVVREANEQFGKINGVLHAAGVPSGYTVATQDLMEAEAVRKPKVQGSVILADLLSEEALDFLVFCSSVSAVLPATTQGAYAAANAFQDSFAEYCRYTLKIPAVAINFDGWQEVGMAAEMVVPEGFETVKEERLRTAINSTEGMETFQRILANWQGSQILTSTIDFDYLLNQAEQVKLPIPLAEEAPLKAQDDELTAIIDIWKEVLAVELVVPTDNFFELGGHSLVGTMVIARVRERFGVVLTVRTLFEAPTPRELAEVLHTLRASAPAPPTPLSDTSEDREEFEI